MTSRSLKIGAAQLPNATDIEENVRRLEAAMRELAELGVRLVLFPECYLTGFSAKLQGSRPELLDPYIDRARAFATELGIVAVLPTAYEVEPGWIENRGYWIGSGYDERFAKTGLTESEQRFFSKPACAGARVIELDGARIGVVVCREVADAPAELFGEGVELDVLLWPGYWRWDPEVDWRRGGGGELMDGAYDLVARYNAPLIQSNFCYNGGDDARAAGPDGRAVVVSAENKLVHQGPKARASGVLVELELAQRVSVVSCRDVALDDVARPRGGSS